MFSLSRKTTVDRMVTWQICHATALAAQGNISGKFYVVEPLADG